MALKDWKKIFLVDVEKATREEDADPEAVPETASQGTVRTVAPTEPSTNGYSPQPELAPGPPPVPVREDGTLDFAAIYQFASVPERTYTAEYVLEVLDSLADVPTAEAKRRLILANLRVNKNSSASPEAVAADAGEKLEALTAFSSSLSEATSKYVSGLEAEVAELRALIELRCREVEQAKSQLRQATDQCRDESKRLEGVVELLGLDSAPPK
jgi:hypothetical protein